MFANQLNKLFDRAEVKLTNLAVVSAMSKNGCSISTPYMSQLRAGVRTNPSAPVVNALAEVFGVPLDYFYNSNAIADLRDTEDIDETVEADAAVVEGLLDERLRRLLTLSLGLSSRSVNLLTDLSSRLRLADLASRRRVERYQDEARLDDEVHVPKSETLCNVSFGRGQPMGMCNV